MNFDEIINIEENIYEEGKKKGMNETIESTQTKSFNFGISKGKQLSLEIGEIYGFVLVLLQNNNDNNNNSY
jgi:hypothetical protein